MLAQLAIV